MHIREMIGKKEQDLSVFNHAKAVVMTKKILKKAGNFKTTIHHPTQFHRKLLQKPAQTHAVTATYSTGSSITTQTTRFVQ